MSEPTSTRCPYVIDRSTHPGYPFAAFRCSLDSHEGGKHGGGGMEWTGGKRDTEVACGNTGCAHPLADHGPDGCRHGECLFRWGLSDREDAPEPTYVADFTVPGFVIRSGPVLPNGEAAPDDADEDVGVGVDLMASLRTVIGERDRLAVAARQIVSDWSGPTAPTHGLWGVLKADIAALSEAVGEAWKEGVVIDRNTADRCYECGLPRDVPHTDPTHPFRERPEEPTAQGLLERHGLVLAETPDGLKLIDPADGYHESGR